MIVRMREHHSRKRLEGDAPDDAARGVEGVQAGIESGENIRHELAGGAEGGCGEVPVPEDQQLA